jgi:hypothetical protein
VIRGQRAGGRVAGLATALALLAGACSTDREVTEPPPEPVTQEAVDAALITVDDLPDGFVAVEEGTPVDAEMVSEHECDDALTDLEPKESAAADFTNGTSLLTSTVAWFPGGGGAVDDLYRAVAEDCEEVVLPEDGVAVRTSELDFGVLSDDTRAIQFELEPATGAIEERDLIIIRNGDLIATIRLVGPRPSDKELLDSVVRTEIGRLGRLADDTT